MVAPIKRPLFGAQLTSRRPWMRAGQGPEADQGGPANATWIAGTSISCYARSPSSRTGSIAAGPTAATTSVTTVFVPARTTGGFAARRKEPDGSICNEVFTDMLGLAIVWVPDSHGGLFAACPDEHLLIPLARSAIGVMTGESEPVG